MIRTDQIETLSVFICQNQNRTQGADNGDVLQDQGTGGKGGHPAQVAGGQLSEDAGVAAAVVAVAVGSAGAAGVGGAALGLNGPTDGAQGDLEGLAASGSGGLFSFGGEQLEGNSLPRRG